MGRRPPRERRRPQARRRKERGFAPRPVAPAAPSAPRAPIRPPAAEEGLQDRLVVGEVKRIGLIAGVILVVFFILFLFWR